jgi:DMSO/TMAO reductase YedYZ molybdopterin-dependent catalytic subunit
MRAFLLKPASGIPSLIVAILLGLSAGCSTGPGAEGGPASPPQPTPEYVEVTEYEGVDLSSIEEFRENSIAGPQQVDVEAYVLRIDGLVDEPMVLAYADVTDSFERYQKVVTLDCVEGWSVTILWEGARVTELIDRAGARPEANTVIFHAVDGYTTSLPLDYLRDRNILLADTMNDVRLPPERGFPFQLVAEEKWGYKWIERIERIELSDDPTYRGYWEQRGYSNEGDRDRRSRE